LHSNWLQDLEKQLIESPRASVGEIGLDGSARDPVSGLKYDFETQIKVFSAQFDLACKLQRPVSIHAVQVIGKLFEFFSHQEIAPPSIMLHSFNSSSDMIKRLIKLRIGERLYFSLSASVNLRSKKFNDMVQSIPDDKILIESDSHDINSVDEAMQTILEKLAVAKGWTMETAVAILSKNTDNYLKLL
jgi:TatD DNase family protein